MAWYEHTTFPVRNSVATSAAMQAELRKIASAFDNLPDLTGNGNKILVVNGAGTEVSVLDASAVRTLLDLGTHYTRQPPRLLSANTKVVRDGETGEFDYTLVNGDVDKFLQIWARPPGTTTGNFQNDITIPTLSSMTVGKRIFLLLKATVTHEQQSCTIRAIPSTSSPPTIKAAVHGKVALTTPSNDHVTLLRATFAEDEPDGGSPDSEGGYETSKAVTLVCTANNEYTLYEGLHA